MSKFISSSLLALCAVTGLSANESIHLAIEGDSAAKVEEKKVDIAAELKKARGFVTQKKYAKALERFEWLFDNCLKHRPSYYGVRLSFLLSDWKELGDVYPKALEKLKTRCKNLETVITNGKGTRELFHDYSSISDTLGKGKDVIVLFKKMHKAKNKLCKEAFSLIEDEMIEAKEYKISAVYIGDIQKYYKAKFDILKSCLKDKYANEELKKDMDKFIKDAFVLQVNNLLKVCNAGKSKDKDLAWIVKTVKENLKSVKQEALVKLIKKP